jgi:cytochrome P450
MPPARRTLVNGYDTQQVCTVMPSMKRRNQQDGNGPSDRVDEYHVLDMAAVLLLCSGHNTSSTTSSTAVTQLQTAEL